MLSRLVKGWSLCSTVLAVSPSGISPGFSQEDILPYTIFTTRITNNTTTEQYVDWRCTVPTFNSCTKCLGCPGIIHDRTLGCHPVSWALMYGRSKNWTWFWFAVYVGHWCAWLIIWHIIYGCLYNQAIAHVRSTGAGIKCLYYRYLIKWPSDRVGYLLTSRRYLAVHHFHNKNN